MKFISRLYLNENLHKLLENKRNCSNLYFQSVHSGSQEQRFESKNENIILLEVCFLPTNVIVHKMQESIPVDTRYMKQHHHSLCTESLQ